MRIRMALLAGGMIAGVALPALAQTSYYIVRGPEHHCQVVDQKPVTKDMTVVGPSGMTYHTRGEAMNAMKTVKVCE